MRARASGSTVRPLGLVGNPENAGDLVEGLLGEIARVLDTDDSRVFTIRVRDIKHEVRVLERIRAAEPASRRG
jgi:hypothetical protein